MKQKFETTLFDVLYEETAKGYHIFLNSNEKTNHSITKNVYYLNNPIPTDLKLKKVWHDQCDWFTLVGRVLLVFKREEPVVLYQISIENKFKDTPMRLFNVSVSTFDHL